MRGFEVNGLNEWEMIGCESDIERDQCANGREETPWRAPGKARGLGFGHARRRPGVVVDRKDVIWTQRKR